MQNKFNFKEILEEGLRLHTQKQTEENLGNRLEYIGSSDIASCLRKAVLSKIEPVEHSLETMLILERGHLTETIIRNALIAKNIPFEEQKTFSGEGDVAFAKVHIDFYLPEEDMILEIKSSKTIPDKPYESWLRQIQYQMGISGIKKAKIICFNINTGDFKEFGDLNKDYFEFNPTIFNFCIQRAKIINQAIQSRSDDDLPHGEIELFCSSCPYRNGCDKFIGEQGTVFIPEEIIHHITQIDSEKKHFEDKVKANKEKLSEYTALFQKMGENTLRGDNHIIKVLSAGGGEYIDMKKAKEILPQNVLRLLTINRQSSKFIRIVEVKDDKKSKKTDIKKDNNKTTSNKATDQKDLFN